MPRARPHAQGAAPDGTEFGALTRAQFMRRHWQRAPLMVRQAVPGVTPPLTRAELFRLATSPDVESRLVRREGSAWTVRHGPMPRRALPPVARPAWTLLVQGLEQHAARAAALLDRFRFVPEARLDDLMISWASDGGGVGPHVDAYDVFLIQVAGRRRWRVAPPGDERFVDGLPLRILQRFVPTQEWTLEPGDMLYLPPHWGHDGVAVGECMTCSVGFRTPSSAELARDLLQRIGERAGEDDAGAFYTDPGLRPTASPGELPLRLRRFARRSVERALAEPAAVDLALGETLTEPKPRVWFHASDRATLERGVRLVPASRMMYDERHLFVNGESFRMSGRDATSMRELADRRRLDARGCARLGADARALLLEWLQIGWLAAGEGT